MKCKNCKYFTEIGDLCDEVLDTIEPGEIDCWGYEAATNADRIRAMIDEELAEFLCGAFDDDDCNGKYICGVTIPDYDDYSILDWLKQPAEEDT